MNTKTSVQVLRGCAQKIAANRGECPVHWTEALIKLFVQPKRDWSQPSAPRIGWKRGELVEALQAPSVDEALLELGDVAYYLAQTPLWFLVAVLPRQSVDEAVIKFQLRAQGGAR